MRIRFQCLQKKPEDFSKICRFLALLQKMKTKREKRPDVCNVSFLLEQGTAGAELWLTPVSVYQLPIPWLGYRPGPKQMEWWWNQTAVNTGRCHQPALQPFGAVLVRESSTQSMGKVYTQKGNLAQPGKRCPGFCSKDVGLPGKCREDMISRGGYYVWSGLSWGPFPRRECKGHPPWAGLQARGYVHTSERYSFSVPRFRC